MDAALLIWAARELEGNKKGEMRRSLQASCSSEPFVTGENAAINWLVRFVLLAEVVSKL